MLQLNSLPPSGKFGIPGLTTVCVCASMRKLLFYIILYYIIFPLHVSLYCTEGAVRLCRKDKAIYEHSHIAKLCNTNRSVGVCVFVYMCTCGCGCACTCAHVRNLFRHQTRSVPKRVASKYIHTYLHTYLHTV